MKYLSFISLFIFISCGGSLSKEQRQRIRENMKTGEIKKLSDADVTEAAFDYSRNIAKIISTNNNHNVLDSLEKKYNVQIVFMDANTKDLRAVEKQIIEAYNSSSTALDDNIQRIGKDSLLYTKPFMKELPDGSMKFEKALGIRMTKKEIVLSIKE